LTEPKPGSGNCLRLNQERLELDRVWEARWSSRRAYTEVELNSGDYDVNLLLRLLVAMMVYSDALVTFPLRLQAGAGEL